MQIKAEMRNIPIPTQLLGNVIKVLIRTGLKGSGFKQMVIVMSQVFLVFKYFLLHVL